MGNCCCRLLRSDYTSYVGGRALYKTSFLPRPFLTSEHDLADLLGHEVHGVSKYHIPWVQVSRELRNKDMILHKYTNLAILTDEELANWIVRSRFMIILRGPPGSGKSYLADCIKTRFPTAHVCSADDFWYLESGGHEYRYDLSQLDDAHTWCLDMAQEAASRGVSPLVIDNTNIRQWEVRRYTELARQFDYFCIVLTPQTPWRFDMEALAVKNVHDVPIEQIEWKIRQFEHVYPLYYGWFWPGLASCNVAPFTPKPDVLAECRYLLAHTWKAFVRLIELPTIRFRLTAACGLSPDASVEDLASYWMSAVEPSFGPVADFVPASRQSRMHITAKFSAAGRAPGVKDYARRAVVENGLLGSVWTLQVAGLFVTTRTIGLRISLPKELLGLWDGEDGHVKPPSHSTDNLVEYVTSPVVDNDTDNQPRPPGSRAHVTLALAREVSPMETGLDLLKIVDAELEGRPDAGVAVVADGCIRSIVVPATGSSLLGPMETIYYYEYSKTQNVRVLYGAYY